MDCLPVNRESMKRSFHKGRPRVTRGAKFWQRKTSRYNGPVFIRANTHPPASYLHYLHINGITIRVLRCLLSYERLRMLIKWKIINATPRDNGYTPIRGYLFAFVLDNLRRRIFTGEKDR